MKTNRGDAPGMSSTRKSALAAGVLYLLTFVSMPIAFLYTSVLTNPNYIVGPGPDTPVVIGAILEIIVALAGIGTAVALFPILRRQNEGAALGYVTARLVECTFIIIGLIFLGLSLLIGVLFACVGQPLLGLMFRSASPSVLTRGGLLTNPIVLLTILVNLIGNTLATILGTSVWTLAYQEWRSNELPASPRNDFE